jgi:hypothetical protein
MQHQAIAIVAYSPNFQKDNDQCSLWSKIVYQVEAGTLQQPTVNIKR